MAGLYSILILLAGFLSPERAAPPEHHARVVTQIVLEESAPSGHLCQTYEDPAQMAEILNYLRRISKQDAVSIDPDSFRTEDFRILLNLSDGSFALYRQLHRDYIQKNNGPWYPMTPADGLQFPPK